MAGRHIAMKLLLLFFITDIRAQFFDFFEGYRPIVVPYQVNGITRYQFEFTTKAPTTTTRSHYDDNNNKQHSRDKKRRVTTDSNNSNNVYTTVKPRKTTNTRNVNVFSKENLIKNPPRLIAYDSDNRWYQKPLIENIADDYTERPVRKTTKSYNNNNGYENNNNNGYENNNGYNNANIFTTKNPFGVKPAVIDSRPPITNRPVTRTTTTRKPSFVVHARPTDSGSISFPEDNSSPELIAGVNEDYMSEAEKRRHEDIAERMCDTYKSLNTKQLQAIPLLPSPEPVQVNVSNCAPINVPLVVGGTVVNIRDYAHMALLGWINLEGGGYKWKCGGSLVSEQFVLTAAHCAYEERDNTVVSGPPRAVQLGSSYLDDPGALVVKVSSVTRHPKYKLPKSYYDIALVKLVSVVSFSEVIKPACLGVPPAAGNPVVATGWGHTKFGGDQSRELRSVSIPVWDFDECTRTLGTSRKLPNGPARDSQICAGEHRGGKDTCQGDSGGPVQIQDGCIWRVVAVTSLGRSCGAANTPGIYATYQKAFISATIYQGKYPENNNRLSNNNNRPITNNNNRNKNVYYIQDSHGEDNRRGDNKRDSTDYQETKKINDNREGHDSGYGYGNNNDRSGYSDTRNDNRNNNENSYGYNNGYSNNNNERSRGYSNNNFNNEDTENNERNDNRNNNNDGYRNNRNYEGHNSNYGSDSRPRYEPGQTWWT